MWRVADARWWEARILWGKVTGAAFNITQQACAWIAPENPQLATRIVRYAIAFALTSKQFLREGSSASEESQAELSSKALLAKEDIEYLLEQKTYPPFYTLDVLRACLSRWSKSCGLPVEVQKAPHASAARRLPTAPTLPPTPTAGDGRVPLPQHYLHSCTAAMEQEVTNMANCIGAMIRIKHGPIPPSQTVFLRCFTFVYCILAPFASVESEAGPFMAVTIGLYSWLILGVQDVADTLEMPFGFSVDHLKMDLYCHVIRAQCSSMLLRTLGPGTNSSASKHIARPRDLSTDFGPAPSVFSWSKDIHLDEEEIQEALKHPLRRSSSLVVGLDARAITVPVPVYAPRQASGSLGSVNAPLGDGDVPNAAVSVVEAARSA